MEIIEWSDDEVPIEGGKKIILLCKDVKKADVDVCFKYHHQDGTTVKEVRGTKTGTNMKGHDSAIVFLTPNLIEPKLSADGRVHAVMFLRNTNDMSATFRSKSNRVEFYFKTTEFKKPAAPLKRSRQPKGTDLSTGELAVPPKSQAAPPSGARAFVQLLRQVSADKTTPNSEDLCALLENAPNSDELCAMLEPFLFNTTVPTEKPIKTENISIPTSISPTDAKALGLLPELKQLSGELGKMEIKDSVGQVIVRQPSSIETPDNSMTNLES